VLALACLTPGALGQAKGKTPAQGTKQGARAPAAEWVREQRAKILDPDGDGSVTGESLFDSVIAYMPVKEAAAFREAALTRRATWLLNKAHDKNRAELAELFRTKPAVMESVAWTLRPEDDIPAAMDLLDRLVRERGGKVDDFANLAAAVCAVYDHPPVKTAYKGAQKFVSLNVPDPLVVFDYFCANHEKMVLDIKTMPPELLLYIVDMNEPKDDWAWALDKYKGDRQIGRHYEDVHYDKAMLHPGHVKKWAEEGWSLQNILKGGGVCEDQAYFAAGIAKANGVPACWVTAVGGQAAHAWVGFLQVTGRNAEWNFNYGRFGEYNNLRGRVTDPQTGSDTADGTLALLAECLMSDADARHEAAAFTDAARRLTTLRGKPFDPARPELVMALAKPRTPDVAASLELLECGLRRSPAYVPGWDLLASWSKDDAFTLEQRQRWSMVLENLCGTKYPDFAFAVLRSMIKGVAESKDRDAMWEWAADRFKARPDLVAAARFEQGADCEGRGDAPGALTCYRDVITRFPNAGPFMVQALSRCAHLMAKAGQEREVLTLYGSAWTRCDKPKFDAPEFMMQSNWFRVGSDYADLLKKAGRAKDAADIEARLGVKQ
jgi:hypothetical protein